MAHYTEFSCTSCQKMFDWKIRPYHNGKYRIHCPCCEHIHYRVLKNGVITEDRFTELEKNDPNIEDITFPKSAARDVQKETNNNGRLSLNFTRSLIDVFNGAMAK